MPLGWTESHPALLGGGLSRRRASRELPGSDGCVTHPVRKRGPGFPGLSSLDAELLPEAQSPDIVREA